MQSTDIVHNSHVAQCVQHESSKDFNMQIIIGLKTQDSGLRF